MIIPMMAQVVDGDDGDDVSATGVEGDIEEGLVEEMMGSLEVFHCSPSDGVVRTKVGSPSRRLAGCTNG